MKRVLITLIPALALPFALRADAPNVFAIRGARIVTAAGQPIESGTVVIRRGVIEAVGAAVAIPPDADVIDGAGHTVYPGLIDLGNTRAADQPAPQMPQNMRSSAEVERWKRTQILKPQARAADAVKVDDVELTRLASAGITTVLALPAGEVISGQSALVNIAAPPDEPQIGNIVDQRRGLIVIKAPVALHVSFPNQPRAAGNAYPQSLMGVIAFVRQSFLDAQHYSLVRPEQARGRGGAGSSTQPIADDPALEAMQPFLNRKLPVVFEANQARAILRTVKMAKELSLDAIVAGGRGVGGCGGGTRRGACARRRTLSPIWRPWLPPRRRAPSGAPPAGGREHPGNPPRPRGSPPGARQGGEGDLSRGTTCLSAVHLG